MKQTASTIRREYPVVVAPYDSDSRYRRVWMRGVGWVQLEREEFELRIRRQFPDIDMDDPAQVHWEDRPWQWPPWHPGEA